MRAVVYDRYGPPEVLHVEEVEQPVPREDEVLVKVHATTVNRLDFHTMEANRRGGLTIYWISRMVFGLRRPRQRILGSEFAGQIVGVGSAVREFAVGDRVYGITGLSFGTHAEFVCVRESSRIARIPGGMTFEEAAPICDGALNALPGLKHVELRRGRRILIYGASGAIGTAAVQLARYLDADITAVCNTKNVELLRSLGADRVIDYTQQDFTKSGQTYDVILDAVGKQSFRRCRVSLEWDGTYLATDGLANVAWSLLTSRRKGQKVRFLVRQTRQEFLFLRDLVEAGKFRPVIDRRYPLEEVVEATRYVGSEQKTGNVVLTVSPA